VRSCNMMSCINNHKYDAQLGASALLGSFCCTMFCRLQKLMSACPATAAAHLADNRDFLYKHGGFASYRRLITQTGECPMHTSGWRAALQPIITCEHQISEMSLCDLCCSQQNHAAACHVRHISLGIGVHVLGRGCTRLPA